ncbi:MAG: NAD-dependent epimerase/dehydratase family protein, partial [Acidimicrobiia bacterium]
MRDFVAGATGAIGKQLVPRLVEAGHEVHVMTRSESKKAMLEELLAGLEALLAPDAQLTGDGGGEVPSIKVDSGAQPCGAHSCRRDPASHPSSRSVAASMEVNGDPGAVLLDGQQRLIGIDTELRLATDDLDHPPLRAARTALHGFRPVRTQASHKRSDVG